MGAVAAGDGSAGAFWAAVALGLSGSGVVWVASCAWAVPSVIAAIAKYVTKRDRTRRRAFIFMFMVVLARVPTLMAVDRLELFDFPPGDSTMAYDFCNRRITSASGLWTKDLSRFLAYRHRVAKLVSYQQQSAMFGESPQ